MNKSRADLRIGLYPIYKVDAEARGTPSILKGKTIYKVPSFQAIIS
jgi:hypothetical protein